MNGLHPIQGVFPTCSQCFQNRISIQHGPDQCMNKMLPSTWKKSVVSMVFLCCALIIRFLGFLDQPVVNEKDYVRLGI